MHKGLSITKISSQQTSICPCKMSEMFRQTSKVMQLSDNTLMTETNFAGTVNPPPPSREKSSSPLNPQSEPTVPRTQKCSTPSHREHRVNAKFNYLPTPT